MTLTGLLLLLLVAGVIGRAFAGFDADGWLTSIASPSSQPCSSRSSGRDRAVDSELIGSRSCVASGND
jgi:hypothetical protein